MTNEVAIKEPTAVSAPMSANILEDMGMSASDLLLPRLMLMQGTSEAVGADKAKMGDVMESLGETILGGINAPISFIPLKTYKTWMVYELSGPSPKFVRTEPVTPENEGRQWECMEDGKPMRYNQVINCVALLRKDAESDDAFPVVISFKRTSYTAGKVLLTNLFKMRILNRDPWAKAYFLIVTKQKNETNYYAVFGVTPDSATNLKEQEVAAMWSGALASRAYKVDYDKETAGAENPVKAPDVVIIGGDTKGEDLPF